MEYNSSRKNKNIYEKDIEQFQQQQNEEILNSTFNKLYHSLVPNCPINYSLPPNFQNLLKRILATNFSVMKNDESVIVNSLLDKISKSSNFNQDIINKFQYLYSRLTKKRSLTKRWGILYILNSLSKNNYKDMNFAATNELQQNYMNMTMNINSNMPNNMLIDNDYQYMNSNGKFLNNNTMQNLNINNSYYNNLSPVSNINERFYDNQSLINNNVMNNNILNNYQELKYVVNQNKTTLKITEKDLINDLLFVFEGINGKYIAYDAAEDAYILNKLYPWNEEIYNIVNSLCEIGWLYKKIKLYLDYFKESNIQSQFIKSFIYSIQNELNDYFKLISFLRQFNLNPNQNINNLNSGKRSQNLNLKNIFLWTLVPKETLKWIAACCEAIHSLKGTSVLSQIYSFVHYGGCGNHLNNILNEVSKPFINFVINWIKYGELQDPYKEFFVDILTGIKDDDIWGLQYQLIGKNVPNFMKREPTIKIFEVGKCIHFIKNHCKENYNLSNLKIILINLIKKYSNYKKEKEKVIEKSFFNEDMQMDLEEVDISMNNSNLNIIKEDEQIKNKNSNNIIKNNIDNFNYDFDYGFDEDKIVFEIESYKSCLNFIEYIFDPDKQDEILNMSFINEIFFNIDVIHKLINKDLVRIIFTKFKFLANLDSINKYLLLGQGDMIQSLMESLFEELDKPANLIFKHNLQSNLESAIRASNAQYNDADCLKKLNIKLNSASVGDIGWDIFCLEYKVDLPLSIIFNNKLLKDYQKLFFFFWKIKRIEYSQTNHIWKQVKSLNQILKKKDDFMKKSIKLSIHFNQEIIHFISNLHNYLALEVLETQYKKLINELPKVNNLDELISKHKKFVDNIKKQCLLDEDNITINKKIANIFEIILKFRTIYDFLYTFLAEQFFENSSKSFVGANSYITQNRLKNIKDYLQQISILYKDFQNQIIELINTITLIGKNDLNFLKIKLDFNYFYSNLEREDEEKKNLEAIKKINAEEEKKKILQESQNSHNSQYDSDNYNRSNDNDNDINKIKNYRGISGNKYQNMYNNNLENNVEGNENVEDEEMDIDESNNYKNLNNINNSNNNINNNIYNNNISNNSINNNISNNSINNNFNNSINNDPNLQQSNNNFNSSNNNINKNIYNNNNISNIPNTFDKRNLLDNISNKKSGKSSNYNNFYNLDDGVGDKNNNINNTYNINNLSKISGIKTSKDNNFKIITKKKDDRRQDNKNEKNDISEFTGHYNSSKNNRNNEFGLNSNINNINNEYNLNLEQKDLEEKEEDNTNNMNNINNDNNNINNINNLMFKTQDEPKTYIYKKNNIQGPGKTYDYKTMTKYKQSDINLNLENADDEDQITTQMMPKIYGVTAKNRGRRDEDDK